MNAGPIQTLGYLNPPWTPNYGYAQVEQIDNRLRIVGLMSLDTAGNLVGPAPVDSKGLPTDHSNMALQMQVAYANASKLLMLLSGSLDDVIEETLYVVELEQAIQVVTGVRRQAYGKPWPRCRSRLVRAPRLLFSEQLVEIALTAEVSICPSLLNPAPMKKKMVGTN